MTFNTLLICSIALVTFLMPLDITVLAMALRSIQSDLGAQFSELQWIANIYNIVYASILPMAGVLVTRYGYRAVFVVSCLIFGGSSVIAGIATSTDMLIAMRLIQGGAGALILISGMTTLREHVPPEKLGFAFGIWGASLGAGVAFGPLIGDLIVNTLGWRWIFFLNLPLTIIAILPFFRLPASSPGATLSIKLLALPGAAGLLLALMCLLADGNAVAHHTPVALVLPILCIIGILAFVLVLRRGLLPDTLGLFLLKNRGFRIGTLLGVLLGFSFWAMILYWPGFLLAHPDVTEQQLAPMFLALTIPLLLLPPLGAYAAQHIPVGVFQGTIALTQALALCLIVMADGLVMLGIGFLLLGVATALINAEVTNLAIGSAPPEHAALATSLNMTARHAALTVGIALYGAVIGRVSSAQLSDLETVEALPLTDLLTKLAIGDVETALSLVRESGHSAAPEMLSAAIRNGFDTMIWVAAAAAIVASGLAFANLPSRRKGMSSEASKLQ
jgi:MFS family permease